jgi:23S rRNA (uracil1939-C5)-methyltransferase
MPPHPGDILELTIDTLAYGGQGIARHEDFVLFVRGAVPGDTVRAEVTRRKRSYGEARLLEIVAPSPARVAPLCRHTESCGGCEWQTLDYAAQLEFKQRQVEESLAHIGGLAGYELETIRGMDPPWRYRNKMEFSFGESDGALVLGLHRRTSWRDVVEIEDCWLAPVIVNRARQAVADACRALALAPYRRGEHEGLLRHLVVRHGRASGDLLINLFTTGRFAQERELAERVAALQPYSSFAVTVNESQADAAIGEGPFMIAGPPYLHEELAGARLRVPAMAFLQTNTVMCATLYETTLRFAAAERRRSAFDLYCGIGSIALALARAAGHVYGMEIEEAAIAAARENARLNAIANVDFSAGDVRKQLIEPPGPGMPGATSTESPAVVVVDPPRAGMARKAVERTASLGADRIVYVSCNPTTLAANGAQLGGLGYRLTRVAPVDMFPQTHHIETVALFERG